MSMSFIFMYNPYLQGCPQRRKGIRMQAVREDVQKIQHPVDSPSHPLRHQAVSMPVLWQAVPPEIRYEEAYLHTYG